MHIPIFMKVLFMLRENKQIQVSLLNNGKSQLFEQVRFEIDGVEIKQNSSTRSNKLDKKLFAMCVR